ncbi:UNKNOWN [Stylonychia lemnae]|uniref:Origin recognition complex subunit 5 C-terminal domain-containing protein n=1 Tax=Stylonychia lemnae TaxID=5949 RepID=A0A078AIW3_STYLE|nr:UNKNOWN [Stylonychia lemnae]|eukprot:CDW82255.1 UNKNOWN [Stylonychia lemnae]
MPQCFSLIVINNSLVQEIEMLKDQQGIFEEYMFTAFFFQPLSDQQIQKIVLERMRKQHGHEFYLEVAFGKMFDQLFQEIKSYTNNLNEYEYFFKLLYPKYTEKISLAPSDEDKLLMLSRPLSNRAFLESVKVVMSSLFMHLDKLEDIQNELNQEDEQRFQKDVEMNKNSTMHTQIIVGQQLLQQKVFDCKQINQLENFKKNINFSFMQSMCLIAAYLAGKNKEYLDQRMFGRGSNAKLRRIGPGKTEAKNQPNQMLLGKTKKFQYERFASIIDYLLSLDVHECNEVKSNIGRSIDFTACINSMVDEGLLKKSSIKKSASGGGDGGDELVTVAFKCNFDKNFIQDVAQKIDFPLEDYDYEDSKQQCS